MCEHATFHSKTTPNNLSTTGFLRINPSTAPLNPPGAAPTLTTIYDEVTTIHISSSTTSPSNSLSKAPSVPKQKSKRRKRSNPFGPKAAKEGVVGTEKEKKRTQTIADSLDLGGDLNVDEENGGSRVVGEGDEMLVRRKAVATDISLGSVP
ncbi:MAG: hypothetical protein Q9175_006494 [Cornicularia normoerica]